MGPEDLGPSLLAASVPPLILSEWPWRRSQETTARRPIARRAGLQSRVACQIRRWPVDAATPSTFLPAERTFSAQNAPVPLGVPLPVGPSQPVVALHRSLPQLPLLPLLTSCRLLVWLYENEP